MALAESKVKETVDKYNSMWDESKGGSAEARKSDYTTLVNQYYDLSTDFYEWGWGTSFHFAQKHPRESLQASLMRHEHYLGMKLGLKPGMKVLDVGCGVGGPMREIARFSGASITGLNNNAYQILRGEKITRDQSLTDVCSFIKADFMNIPQEDNTYNAIYAIEATCHAPDKVGIYSEIYRVLKPGGYFAAYEWCMTDKYNPENEEHREIKKNIEVGDGLPDIDTVDDVLKALKASSFEIIESKDLALPDPHYPEPWYQPLAPAFSLSGLKLTRSGIWVTHQLVSGLEKLRLIPKGSTQAHGVLTLAATGLVLGGQKEIFTPMFFFLVRKPLH